MKDPNNGKEKMIRKNVSINASPPFAKGKRRPKGGGMARGVNAYIENGLSATLAALDRPPIGPDPSRIDCID